jgi:general secretion pathway protein G
VPTSREPQKIFFPWERRRGLRSFFLRARAQRWLLVALALGAFAILRHRETHAAEVRSTRAEITTLKQGMWAWRADHDRGCPSSVSELVAEGYLAEVPLDAWGRGLRLTCPGRKAPQDFDVSSDGPDGEPGGLDRVE